MAQASDSVGDLIDRLLSEQAEGWRSGKAVPVETLLRQHPELSGTSPFDILTVVFNEYRLRDELGQNPSLEEFIRRFPEHADDLRGTVEVYEQLLHNAKLLPEPEPEPPPTDEQSISHEPRIPEAARNTAHRIGRRFLLTFAVVLLGILTALLLHGLKLPNTHLSIATRPPTPSSFDSDRAEAHLPKRLTASHCLTEYEATREGVLGVAISPDGLKVLSGHDDGTVRVWTSEGKLDNTLPAQKSGVTSIAFIPPEGRRAIFTCRDGGVRSWDLVTNSVDIVGFHGEEAWGVSVTADGQYAVTGGYDKVVRLWRLKDRSGSEELVLNGHTANIRGVAISPDGKTIVSAAADGTIRAWDAATGTGRIIGRHFKLARTPPDGWFWGVAFGPHGWVTSTHDEAISQWRLTPPFEELQLLGQPGRTIEGIGEPDERYLLCVAVSKDCQLIAAGGIDRILHVWNSDGRELFQGIGHNDRIRTLVFSPDGQRIVTGSEDGTVRIWHLP